MRRLFLIRHGEPEAAWGAEGGDPGLSDQGRRQAEAAAGELASHGEMQSITSPMRRCRETAAPYALARGAEPLIERRVGEVAAPAGTADRRAWLLDNFPWQGGAQRMWRDLAPELRDWRDDMLRFVSSLQCDTAIFTHFVAINAIVGAALGRQETIVCTPAYASITELSIEKRMLSLVRLGNEMRAGDVH